jgi:transposase-like protein
VDKDINFAMGLYSRDSKSTYGKAAEASDDVEQAEFHNNHNLVACPYCNQSIRIPNILPSSKIRCQSCAQKFSFTRDRFGNRQVQKESAIDYASADTIITSTHDAFSALGIKSSSDSSQITKAYRE